MSSERSERGGSGLSDQCVGLSSYVSRYETQSLSAWPRQREGKAQLTTWLRSGFGRHNTFASGGSDQTVSIWDHTAKKRMKQYTGFSNEVSSLAFSPDGKYLAIGQSYEHDNGVEGDEMKKRVALQIKTTVMEDCRVSALPPLFNSIWRSIWLINSQMR